MPNDAALPRRRLRLLGTILLIVACLGLLVGLGIVPVTLSLSAPPESPADPEIQEMLDEVLLPEGVSLDTTVRELLAYDRAFFEENRGRFRALSFLSAIFVLAFAGVCLWLALSWRHAVAFGRSTIVGLRVLGLLLVLQFVVGWLVGLAPESWHADLFFWSDLYQSSVDWLVTGGPTLSSGLLFLILSWVLDYGRKIKEEQALTI